MPPDHCWQQMRLWSPAELPCLLYLHLSLILTIQTNYVTLAFTTLADIVTTLWLRYQPHLITSTGVLLELQTLLEHSTAAYAIHGSVSVQCGDMMWHNNCVTEYCLLFTPHLAHTCSSSWQGPMILYMSGYCCHTSVFPLSHPFTPATELVSAHQHHPTHK